MDHNPAALNPGYSDLWPAEAVLAQSLEVKSQLPRENVSEVCLAQRKVLYHQSREKNSLIPR